MKDFTTFIEKKQQLLESTSQLINLSETEFNNLDVLVLKRFEHELSQELTFKMLCIGDFSSGKSTFINRFLLKEDVLPAFPKPTTTRLTKIRYGNLLKAQLVFENDSIEEVSSNVTARLLEAVSTGGKDIGLVKHVILDSPSQILQDGIELVDAPGLNDPDSERMKLTFDYLHIADAVLFFLNAQQPWTNYQKHFFERDLLTKKDIDKLFIVVNYWDQIDLEEREDVLVYINEQLKSSLSIQRYNENNNHPIDLHILPVSSKTGENGDNVKQYIWNYLANRKAYDVLSGKVNRLNGYIDNYIKTLENKINLIKLDNISKEKKRLSLEREVSDYKKRRDDFIGDLNQSLKPEFQNYQQIVGDLFDQLDRKIHSMIQQIAQENLSSNEINTKLTMRLSRLQDDLVNEMEIKEDNFMERIKNIIEEQKGIIDITSDNVIHIDDYYLKWDRLSNSSNLQTASITTGAVGVAGILIGSGAFAFTSAQGSAMALWASIAGSTSSASMMFGLPGIAVGVLALASSAFFKYKSIQETNRELKNFAEQIAHTINQEKAKIIRQLIKSQKESIDKICNNVDHEITLSFNMKLEELKGIKLNDSQQERFESTLKRLNSMKLQVNL